MLFTKLKLNYFGKFQNREIELKPGINLIYGENEAGKSTLHTFIRGMLFGIERLRGRGAATKEDLYTRYLPWEYPGAYGGSLDIMIGDREYRLQRSFHANDKSFNIIELSTGREVKLKEGYISELIPGLTEGAFKNTISIEQLKAQTDSELAVQVRNYIANLSIAKSKEVDVAKAVSMLTEQRKQLESTPYASILKALQAEIDEGLIKEEKIDRLTLALKDMQKEEQKLAAQKEAVRSDIDNEAARRMEQLPAIIEKYHSYLELTRQENVLEAQSRELENKIGQWEMERQDSSALKEDIEAIRKLQSELAELEKQEPELQREQENCNKEGKKNLLISFLPSVTMAIIINIVMWNIRPTGIILSLIFIVAGFLGYAVLNRKSQKRQRTFSDSQVTLKQQKAAVQAKMDDILHKNGITRVEGLSMKQDEAVRNSYALEHSREQKKDVDKRKSEIQGSLDVAYDTIMKYIQYFIREEELTSDTMQRLQAEISKRKQDTSDKLSKVNSQYEDCRLATQKLRWEISALEGNEEELLKNKAKYIELDQQQKENAVELQAVKLALASIQELSADIHDSFGQQLNIAVSKIISDVTKNKYTDLKIDEKLEVKVGWNKNYVLLERLSAGTIEQVYFALRMAVADLLLGKDEVPLLLDDSFALYDDTRVKSMLTQLTQKNQVLLFTCHKREQTILNELGLPYHFIDLSC